MTARLIINADDFGLTAGINRGIVELHQAGAVSSATLMATAPAFDDAARRARENPGLGVGCHLVFVDGFPAAHPESIPTLLGADGKTFRPSLADFAQAALRGTIDPADLVRETQAQIQLLQRAGLDVTHIDTHKHTHLFPAIAGPVAYAAGRCGVHALRRPFEPAWAVAAARGAARIPLMRRMQLRALGTFQQAFQRVVREQVGQGLVPDGTMGIAATGSLDEATLRAMLATLPEDGVFELCCHPGYRDAALDGVRTRLKSSREREMTALRTVMEEVSRTAEAPELIHYGSLGIAGLQRASGHYEPYNGYEKVL